MMDPRDQTKEKEGTNKNDSHTVSIRDVCRGGGTRGGSAGWLAGMQEAGQKEEEGQDGSPLTTVQS